MELGAASWTLVGPGAPEADFGDYEGEVIRVMPNGSAFVDCPMVKESSGRDPYISATVMQQCGLVKGDNISFMVAFNKMGTPQVKAPCWKLSQGGAEADPTPIVPLAMEAAVEEAPVPIVPLAGGEAPAEEDEPQYTPEELKELKKAKWVEVPEDATFYIGSVNQVTSGFTRLLSPETGHTDEIFMHAAVAAPTMLAEGNYVAFQLHISPKGQPQASAPAFKFVGKSEETPAWGQYFGTISNILPGGEGVLDAPTAKADFGDDIQISPATMQAGNLSVGDALCFGVQAAAMPMMAEPCWVRLPCDKHAHEKRDKHKSDGGKEKGRGKGGKDAGKGWDAGAGGKGWDAWMWDSWGWGGKGDWWGPAWDDGSARSGASMAKVKGVVHGGIPGGLAAMKQLGINIPPGIDDDSLAASFKKEKGKRGVPAAFKDQHLGRESGARRESRDEDSWSGMAWGWGGPGGKGDKKGGMAGFSWGEGKGGTVTPEDVLVHDLPEEYVVGTIVSKDPSKGVTFIAGPNTGCTEEIYCHNSVADLTYLQRGDLVVFRVHMNKQGKPQASAPLWKRAGRSDGKELSFGHHKGRISSIIAAGGFVDCPELQTAERKDAFVNSSMVHECGLWEGCHISFDTHPNAQGNPQVSSPMWVCCSDPKYLQGRKRDRDDDGHGRRDRRDGEGWGSKGSDPRRVARRMM
mmetsp:Transcript_14099/g.30616  ORF Transcript_14099/g.30616 Transcript_14099/m.30616 type:complete len:688 (-) Transcript_14099:37-2100(-)